MMTAADTNLKQAWQRIALRLKAELGDDLYTSWFMRVEPEEFSDGRLAVSVPTRFLRSWLETHYAGRLQKASEAELGEVESVQIRLRTHGLPVRSQPDPDKITVRPAANGLQQHASMS